MVTAPRRLNERGVGRTGCLLFVLIGVAVIYFGLPIIGFYIKDNRLENEMRTQARFAPSIDDGTIRRRLLQTINDLGIPEEARQRLQIIRPTRPRQIIISTTYQVTIELPFVTKVLIFEPEVRERM